MHPRAQTIGVPRPRDLDRSSGKVVRYERERPGELVPVDIKKQDRIPAGSGWRVQVEQLPLDIVARANDFIYAAVDDRSRLAYYAEILPDARKETASAFMTRAIRFYADHGVRIERVMTTTARVIARGTSRRPSRAPASPIVERGPTAPDQR